MIAIYQKLLQYELFQLQSIQDSIPRGLYQTIDRSIKHIMITGQRGVGKSTLLLQRRREWGQGFYFSADHSLVMSVGLFAFVDYLVIEQGLTMLFIDEIFRYPGREQELKSCLDSFPQVSFVCTGSNSLQVFSKTLDIYRRVSVYEMGIMTLREYALLQGVSLPTLSRDQIVTRSVSAHMLIGMRRTMIDEYMKGGCYPLISSLSLEMMQARLFRVIEDVIIQDIGSIVDIHTTSLFAMKKLFYFLGTMPPSDLSITGLSQKLQINRESLETVLHLLSAVGIIHMVPKFGNPSDVVRKEYKILLGNPNLYALYGDTVGAMRESRFVAMMRQQGYEYYSPRQGDYVIIQQGKHYLFEIGGPNKTRRQLSGAPHSYLIKDELTHDTALPLWWFGLLG